MPPDDEFAMRLQAGSDDAHGPARDETGLSIAGPFASGWASSPPALLHLAGGHRLGHPMDHFWVVWRGSPDL